MNDSKKITSKAILKKRIRFDAIAFPLVILFFLCIDIGKYDFLISIAIILLISSSQYIEYKRNMKEELNEIKSSH